MEIQPTITTTGTRSGVTSEDAAAYLGITPGTIYVLIARGNLEALPQGMPGDRHLLISPDSIVAYRSNRRQNRRWHDKFLPAEAR